MDETDVPIDGDLVKFVSANDRFEVQPGDIVALALDDLTDVTILTPTAGQVLRKGAGDFANANLIASDIPELPTSKITGTAVITTDSRLSDARTPLAHSHPESDVTNLVTDLAAKFSATNRQTVIVDSEMTSIAASKLVTDLVPDARLGSGVPSATNFLRGDRIWATPAGGGASTETLYAQWSQSMTKTNIGATFTDVYSQTNADGKSVSIDTNGKTEVKLSINWNKIGTGTQTVQVIDVVGSVVLISMNVVSGYQETALTAIPAGLLNSIKRYKLQAKSTTALDDPIFEGAAIYLK